MSPLVTCERTTIPLRNVKQEIRTSSSSLPDSLYRSIEPKYLCVNDYFSPVGTDREREKRRLKLIRSSCVLRKINILLFLCSSSTNNSLVKLCNKTEVKFGTIENQNRDRLKE